MLKTNICKNYTEKKQMLQIGPKCTCLGGSVDRDTVRTDREGLSEEPRFNSLRRPVDFVFGFQGRML